jgi:hypothetical protein
LGPRIVEAIEIELKKGRNRPDSDSGENRAVTSRKLARTFVHRQDIGMARSFSSLICWPAGGESLKN